MEGVGLEAEAPAEAFLGADGGREVGAGGGGGGEVAEGELDGVEVEPEGAGFEEVFRAVPEGGVEDAAAAVGANPGEGVVVVVA